MAKTPFQTRVTELLGIQYPAMGAWRRYRIIRQATAICKRLGALA